MNIIEAMAAVLLHRATVVRQVQALGDGAKVVEKNEDLAGIAGEDLGGEDLVDEFPFDQ